MSELIRCRAKLGKGCNHGEEDLAVENPTLDPWRDDRTYDKTTDTIVCDWCFLQLPNNGRFKDLNQLQVLMSIALERMAR